MYFYHNRVKTILDPLYRVRIPYNLGYLIDDSNQDGCPDWVRYHSNKVFLEKNKITIVFPVILVELQNYDGSVFQIKSTKQTSYHLNIFSHYRDTPEMTDNKYKDSLVIQKREVLLGKFRVHKFKGSSQKS